MIPDLAAQIRNRLQEVLTAQGVEQIEPQVAHRIFEVPDAGAPATFEEWDTLYVTPAAEAVALAVLEQGGKVADTVVTVWHDDAAQKTVVSLCAARACAKNCLYL